MLLPEFRVIFCFYILYRICVKLYRAYYGIVREVAVDSSLKYEMSCVAIAVAVFIVSTIVEDKSYESDLYALHFSRSGRACR